ncbi:outer membrane beta-barrel protein [Qipengyuania sp.]|uniref:outer membrane beta-barrel protein n=1 Tax=Qipengyuania sp. TaxID=2004515 RepID=UPI0035C7EA4D
MNGIPRAFAAGVASTLVILPAGLVHAQDGIGAPDPTSASASSGGLGSSRDQISFRLDARYDSNVPRINDASAGLSRLDKEDVRISPSVQLDVARTLGRHQVGLQAILGYDFYVRNDSLNSERLQVEPSVFLDLPVCDLTVTGLASRRQSSLGELVYVGVEPTLGTDNLETRKRIVGQLACGSQYGLRPTFEVERGSGFNSNSLRRVADYETTRVQPGLTYASPGLGEISIFAFRQDTDLPNQLTLTGQSSGYSVKGYGLAYRRDIGTRLQFSGSISQVDVTSDDSVLPSRSGVNGSLELTLLASERLQFMAYGSREFTSTLTGVSTYELSQAYGLTANYAANQRLRFRVSGSVSPRRFFYARDIQGPFIGEQTVYDISGGASYELNRRISLTLDAGYQRRTTDQPIFDYDNVFAQVGLSFSL